MKFWDTSAIAPLLVEEPSSGALIQLYKKDSGLLVWWLTEVEAASALGRLDRAGALTGDQLERAIQRLGKLKKSWNEIQPVDPIRELARRLLRVHSLRAADAMQLAAALFACENRPTNFEFVCLDGRLADAAAREGFTLFGDEKDPPDFFDYRYDTLESIAGLT